MTIALISIPHQRAARIHWFDDRDDIMHAAQTAAVLESKEKPTNFDDAIAALAHDWNGHLLIESATDLHLVLHYHGHQAHRVRAMFDDIADEFLPEEVHTDDC